MLSCFTGHVHVTKVLLAHDADVNLQNNEGITALMMSSYNGHAEIVELLLHKKYGADISRVTNTGMTALDFSKNESVSSLLKEFGGKPSLGKRTASMRDPTAILSSRVVMYNVKDLQDKQIEEKLEDILQALVPRPSSDHETADSLHFEPDEKPELRDAFKLFRHFDYNWEAIGALLKIPVNTIKDIKHDWAAESKVCMREMLRIWLKRTFPLPNMGRIKGGRGNCHIWDWPTQDHKEGLNSFPYSFLFFIIIYSVL